MAIAVGMLWVSREDAKTAKDLFDLASFAPWRATFSRRWVRSLRASAC
jgi:hypothetical protein